MKQKLLLLSDVHNVGKTGDIVSVKPGYARNFLLPKKRAIVADRNTIRMQEKLKKERAAQALIDKKESEALAKKLSTITLKFEVKVDPEGHLYGSVGVTDILKLLVEEGIELERYQIALGQPIKKAGAHKVTLKLKESVEAFVAVHVIPEGGKLPPVEETREDVIAKAVEEEQNPPEKAEDANEINEEDSE